MLSPSPRRLQPDRVRLTCAPACATIPAHGRVAAAPDGDDVGARLLAAACRGEHSAFVAIRRHYDRRLRLVAYRLLRDRELVDDALQDVALKAFAALPQFRGEASVGTWLHRITHTTCLDYLRRSRPLELVPPDELPEVHRGVEADTAELVVRRDDLRRRLSALPPAQRITVLLVDHGGYDYRSAAGDPGDLAWHGGLPTQRGAHRVAPTAALREPQLSLPAASFAAGASAAATSCPAVPPLLASHQPTSMLIAVPPPVTTQ